MCMCMCMHNMHMHMHMHMGRAPTQRTQRTHANPPYAPCMPHTNADHALPYVARPADRAARECAQCLDTAHHMVLEQTLHRHRDDADASARLDLREAMFDDAIDARKLRALASRYKQPVLWIQLADAAAPPPIYGLSASEKDFMKELVSSDRESGCADAPNMLRGIP